jgi:CO/xanthine dehydrogenase FAD-binding subunit
MDYIRSDESNIYIGANTRLETILKHQETPKVLKDIIGEMASPAIRHTATLAGNIANASPAGDSLVALYLLDAKVKIQRLGQSRLTKVSDFILGVRKVDLKIDEMITEIIIPKVSFDRIVFKKVAPRQSDAISKLSFVGAITVNHGVIEDIRFAFGAVYMTVVRNPSIEASYVGWTIEALKANIDQIINDYDPLIQPIDDQRSNRIYRKKVAINLIKDFINQS